MGLCVYSLGEKQHEIQCCQYIFEVKLMKPTTNPDTYNYEHDGPR